MNRGLMAVLSLAAACCTALFFGACGSDTPANGDGGNGDAALDQTIGLGDAAQVFPCDGCGPFPPLGTTTCAPNVLGPSKLVYPIDGLLLPPNMNVLEVQFVPPQGAIEFEVDFENSVTDVRVQTLCNPVPDVRGGASKGCGLTLPQLAWNDIANANRDGNALNVSVRATIDGSCVTGPGKLHVSGQPEGSSDTGRHRSAGILFHYLRRNLTSAKSEFVPESGHEGALLIENLEVVFLALNMKAGRPDDYPHWITGILAACPKATFIQD